MPTSATASMMDHHRTREFVDSEAAQHSAACHLREGDPRPRLGKRYTELGSAFVACFMMEWEGVLLFR